MSRKILSLVFGGHDTAAAVMIDGKLVAACAQERMTGDKHSRAFPVEAMNETLRLADVALADIDELAFVNDTKYYIREMYLRPALESDARIGVLLNDIDRIRQAYHTEELIREKTGYTGNIRFYRHHLCHLASAYYPSGFDEALLFSLDGVGEKECAMIGIGRHGKIEVVHDRNHYPHSLGLLYSALTFYLGFKHHCDEGIVMGLAPYGHANAIVPSLDRSYLSIFEEIVRETGDYDFEIDQSWMAYYEQRDVWVSKKFYDAFGPKREPNSAVTQHYMNIAAALQQRLEDLVLAQMRRARKQFGLSRLALAGGVALNCSMNGKIEASGLFDEIFVQPASGDDGTTIGACYLAEANLTNELRPIRMHNFYKGSSYSDDEISRAVSASGLKFERPDDLYARTAKRLAEGKIVAWFQGGAEFGPRALGNRSILARPYPGEMKDHINARVKFREYFRPFAPAVLAEEAANYFSIRQESPHMLIACQAQPDKRDAIAATVHVDGSCRVQTVFESNNPRFYQLLKAFQKETGLPVLLNTSFNVKGQPIVNSPKQAIDSYASTQIDCLVLGDFFIEKPN
jgi:carbamoyltransferase